MPIVLIGANGMTWWPTDEMLWNSQEAQEFFEKYFSECPYTSEEYEAINNYTEAMGMGESKQILIVF